MIQLKFKLTLTEEMLGTTPGNPDIAKEFVISKHPDGEQPDERRAAEDINTAVEKAMTVFGRVNESPTTPFIWDYQVKGFIKEAMGAITSTGDYTTATLKAKGLTKWTYKRTIDNLVFTYPRLIVPELSGEIGNCQRSLRVDTLQGARVSLANSETIPAGSTMLVTVDILCDALESFVMACMDYGKRKGLGQWRNSGKGRFTFELLERIQTGVEQEEYAPASKKTKKGQANEAESSESEE